MLSLLLAAFLAPLVACGDDDPAGPDNTQGCLAENHVGDPAETVRLHVVNISNEPGIVVQATIAGRTCGPVALPVDAGGGLELAQLLLPAMVGSVVRVDAGKATPDQASVTCTITEAAVPEPGSGATRLQAFVDLTYAGGILMACADGLAAQ
jgi:hypothetical protein